MKHSLFSTQPELEPNQSPAHKQPWKLEMLGSSSKMVPKWQDFFKPKHWVWSVTPYFGKAWMDTTFSPWINHFLGCTVCEILCFCPRKKGCRGERGRYSAHIGDKGLCFNKLPMCYPYTQVQSADLGQETCALYTWKLEASLPGCVSGPRSVPLGSFKLWGLCVNGSKWQKSVLVSSKLERKEKKVHQFTTAVSYWAYTGITVASSGRMGAPRASHLPWMCTGWGLPRHVVLVASTSRALSRWPPSKLSAPQPLEVYKTAFPSH